MIIDDTDNNISRYFFGIIDYVFKMSIWLISYHQTVVKTLNLGVISIGRDNDLVLE